MGKYVFYKTLHISLVLVLITRCLAVPVRPRRQVQDLPLLHEDYDGDDYSSDNSGGHIVDDGTSHLTPLDETGTDHLHGHVDYVDNYHGNSTGNNDHIGSSDNLGDDGNNPDSDLENGQSIPHVEPDIDHGGHLDENVPDRDSDSDLQVQGLPISGNVAHNSSSGRQGHIEAIDSTGTDRDDHYVINAVGRAMHNVNVSTVEESHSVHGPPSDNHGNTNTSERPQVHHGFLMGGDVIANTSEENKVHHGFLMGGDVQNMDNEHNTNSLTSRLPTSPQSVIPSSRTTTSQSFITVRLSNMSSHELTESSSPEHAHNNDIVIDRTDQTSGRRGDHDQGPQDGHETVIDADKDSTTESALTSEGHVATLPGEPILHGHDNENGEHLTDHGEAEGSGQGIDVPINKGEHQHNNNNEENNEPGLTRHTSNPVVRTPQHPENIPVTETTTPNLIILPTPANLEPEERNPSSNMQEPQSTITVHGGPTEHLEPDHEGPGESGIHGNNEPGNYSEETNTPTSEGHIEFVTELPEIHGDNEFKPIKNLPKYSTVQSDLISTLISPTLASQSLERSDSMPTETGEYFSESSERNSIFQTDQPNILHSSIKYSDITPTCLQSENKICSTSATVEQILPSQSFLHVQSTDFSEQSTQNLPDTTSILILDSLRSATETLLYTQFTSPDQDNMQLNTISPSKTVEESVQIQITKSSINIPVESVVPTESSSKPSSSRFFHQSSEIASFTVSTLPSTSFHGLESSTANENVFTDNVLHTSQVSANTGIHQHSVYTSTEEVLHASAEHSSTNNGVPTLNTSKGTQYPSSDLSLTPPSSSTSTTTSHFIMSSSQEQISQILPTTTMAQQTTRTPVTFPMLTSTNATTKKKVEHSTTPTLLTTHSTQKKPNSDKEPDKPENGGSSSAGTTTTTTSPPSAATTTTYVISTTLPTTTMRPATTQKIETSTQPSVYIEIQLRMELSDFCSSKIEFISVVRDIIFSEKGYVVQNEQFVLSTEDCTSANNLLLEPEHIQVITIKMYIVDNDGKLDIMLTTETPYFLLKGFQKSNFLKDKIVSVHTVKRKPSDLHTEGARSDRKQEAPNVTMVIVLASMGGVCCVALVILQVLIHRRVKTKRKQRQVIGHRASLQSMDHVALGVIPKSRPSSGYWNPALDDTLELPEPDEHSHVLSFSGLANFCMDSKAIYSEFQTIPFDEVDLTSIPIGEEDKNRFANVLPHKHNRVYLKKSQENKSGYINANYVDGYMGEKRVYIATQSPLVNTVDDFWRMIWEQQTRTILMLNPMTPQGKPKQSTCYWPDNMETDNQREFEDYIVTLKKRDVQNDYVDCTLEIIDIEKNLKREIHHFWMTCWSDTGPPEPLTFVKFVLDTRPHYENSGSPVVVHCGPGTGRTGTFIGVDTCMRMFEDRRRVDIQSCIHKMRGERAGAVQTKEQYLLIYQALNEYAVILSSPSISTRSSVITLHAML